MKVQSVILHFNPSSGGPSQLSFDESQAYPDLHYIVREGQHIVNFTRSDGRRAGVSFPAYGVSQVNTVL